MGQGAGFFCESGEKFAVVHGTRFAVAQGHTRKKEWDLGKAHAVVNRDHRFKLLGF